MKTLNKVLKAWEICESDIGLCKDCPYLDECNKGVIKGQKIFKEDVFYYLKQLEKIINISIECFESDNI